ncbi:hypothetical protein ACFX13_032896 [Malus domestica]
MHAIFKVHEMGIISKNPGSKFYIFSYLCILCFLALICSASSSISQGQSLKNHQIVYRTYLSDIGDTDMEVEDGGDEPQFVSASKSSIEELKRTTVETSTMCSICREEMMIGLEATRMPCSHLYHGDCIAEWVQRSRICPIYYAIWSF